MADILIRCPKCRWEPLESSRWQCTCGHLWNTFSTAARCPRCTKVWQDTQCLKCKAWSPHVDWYEGLDDIINKLKEEIKQGWLVTIPITARSNEPGNCES